MLCSFVKIVIINTRLRIINFCWSQSLFSATIQKPMTNCDRVFMEKTRVMQKYIITAVLYYFGFGYIKTLFPTGKIKDVWSQIYGLL